MFQNIKLSFINKAAIRSGFLARKDGKIEPAGFLISFMKLITKGTFSYAAWARELAVQIGNSITKQAVEDRMNPKTESFVKSIFQELFKREIQTDSSKRNFSKRFRNVYCEDSTHINLPEELSSYFPGNVSRGRQKAVAKIHTLYNLTSDRFSMLNIHSFTKNDQSLASSSLQYLKQGDLLLRDLGFLVLSCLKTLNDNGVFFISRKTFSICIYEENGNKLNLLKELKKKGRIDREVLVGNNRQKMRLIVLSVPPDHAAERRRKAKKDRDRRLNHSKEYYKLLGYTVLLTNVSKEQCAAADILKFYGLRWKIEMIFKSWKSVFSFQKAMPSKCKNIYRIHTMIYLLLIYVLMFQRLVREFSARQIINISPLKLAAFLKQHFEFILLSDQFNEELVEKMSLHEVRKDRETMAQKRYALAA